MLGEGGFAKVFCGLWRGLIVGVKVVCDDGNNEKNIIKNAHEIAILRWGVCVRGEGCPFCVKGVEGCRGSSLRVGALMLAAGGSGKFPEPPLQPTQKANLT